MRKECKLKPYFSPNAYLHNSVKKLDAHPIERVVLNERTRTELWPGVKNILVGCVRVELLGAVKLHSGRQEKRRVAGTIVEFKSYLCKKHAKSV